MMIQKL